MNGPSLSYDITLPAAGADLKSYHVFPHPGLQQHHDQQQSHIYGGAPLHSIAELSSSRKHQYPNDDDAEVSFHADAKGEIDCEANTTTTTWMLQDSEVIKPLVPASALNLCILTFGVFLIPSVYVVIYVTEIGAASLLAASLGGAVGVGVAYPIDTLKTKAQVYGQQRRQERQRMMEQRRLRLEQRIANNSVCVAEQHVKTPTGSCVQTLKQSSSSSSSSTPIKMEDDVLIDYEIFDDGCDGDEDDEEVGREEEVGLLSLVGVILKNEGISGFYGGVKAMMIGQALIKSVAYSANELALGDNSLLLVAGFDDEGAEIETETTPLVTLILAAGFAGFVASFVVAPVERVKVMMQAQQNSLYKNELECIRAVLDNEGWIGLFSRGLGLTLAREVPSYAIYFVAYRTLMSTTMAGGLGSMAPLVCGAMSGCACWIPVYPIDVVKTLVQNTEGSGAASKSAVVVAIQLYMDEGIHGFFNGLTAKLLRASLNAAVTFCVYDLVINLFIPSTASGE